MNVKDVRCGKIGGCEFVSGLAQNMFLSSLRLLLVPIIAHSSDMPLPYFPNALGQRLSAGVHRGF